MEQRLLGFALLLLTCHAASGPAGRYVRKGGNFVEIKSAGAGKYEVFLSGNYGMNTCQIETGPVKLENSELTYNNEDDNCHLRLALESATARVEQKGDCGCGLNVNLTGVYKRQSKTPKSSKKP